MPKFWASVARVLNHGGTVALWSRASLFCRESLTLLAIALAGMSMCIDVVDPDTPNAARVQETMLRLEREHLAPYELPGNRLTREGYANLLLPWTCDPAVEGFSQAGFTRLEWDRDGHLSDPDHFFLGDRRMTLTQAEQHLGTSSMVTRWREANPQLAGTDKDVVKIMTRDMREAMGREDLVVGSSCHLLLFKKDQPHVEIA